MNRAKLFRKDDGGIEGAAIGRTQGECFTSQYEPAEGRIGLRRIKRSVADLKGTVRQQLLIELSNIPI
ncbi:hypothetical protein MJ904_20840 [Massilia sp. MB5]|uniref:hypothetical protein n=1 Tax=Massilia sp. MB5 TaxID=2919578 RepID=UPI001F0E8228|nr:hypothetical protein [Massilia sp. MB5]UMR29486.1 hypothetical protein MJ904_20840 [Massilia sp. MB5]